MLPNKNVKTGSSHVLVAEISLVGRINNPIVGWHLLDKVNKSFYVNILVLVGVLTNMPDI